ncbi:GNAT family N-acetyltransferase [Pseudescherichia sp.]|uniref:GNAT family N-acetyltransferase n=1 Tax=Pseudescherichia sp. TaxID=2055881 RepID=UPI0028A167CF|nr:GNAT family N-acetyltransferase [Pseudescherichia sp.]
MTYLFRQNSVCQDAIAAHFAACEPAFVLALREQTDIDLYSEKIIRLARCFEAWEQEKLIGLVAAYYNQDASTAYITNVSVLPMYQSQNVGSQLITLCIDALTLAGAKKIALDVAVDNTRAKQFYIKHAFIPQGINGLRLHMIRYGD